MKIRASAPSNIALIKYMGKTDSADNRPTNSSLSWTLENLRSTVEVEWNEAFVQDEWAPLLETGVPALDLSDKGRAKFLKHVARIREQVQKKGFFKIRSANNFPSDCGIASSASSFAALTQGIYQIYEAMDPSYRSPGVRDQAEMSRRGSGSSCRSFFSPWALWSREGVQALELPMQRLGHQVVILNAAKKDVSSSDAHIRCMTSLLFRGRVERAEERLRDFISAMRSQDWERAYHLSWAEFYDMHALFETAQPAFGYFHPDSVKVLALARDLWNTEKDGPLVTMDAGANVHFLWRENQEPLAERFGNTLSEFARVLTSSSKGSLLDSDRGRLN